MSKTNVKTVTLKIAKTHKGFMVLLFFLIAAVVILSLLPPQILKIIIDDYLLMKKPDGLMKIGILYLSTFVLIGLLDFVKNLMITVLGERIVKGIRFEMNGKLTRLKASYYTKNTSGSISSKFINDVENISSLFTDGVIGMIIDCCKIIGIVLSIWFFDFKLGIFTLCLIPLILVITQFFRKKILVAQHDNLKQLGKVNNHISETIKNIIMIKTFNREKYMEDNYKVDLRENMATNKRVNFFDSCYSPLIQVITALSVAIVLYFAMGADNVLGITIGMVAAAINYITNLFQPIDSLGMEIQSIQRGISGIERVDAFLNEKEDTVKDIRYEDLKVSEGIEFNFEKISFAYDDGPIIFSDFNLKITQGENVAFVGRTGNGKTTLFRLIIGSLSPTDGRLLLNGFDTDRILNKDKRKIFGYVEQDFTFIDGDIFTQISLGDLSIPQEKIKAAVDFVGMSEYIKALPDGFHTNANEELFSQGQKQLLAIARAMVLDPPILLLDEVTSGLDSSTESRVVKVLKEASKGKTILSIAHRQSTISEADRIIKI